MITDDTECMTWSAVLARFFYESGVPRIMCSSDNDGYPSCQGDGSMCGYSHVLGEQICKHVPEGWDR